ncbi:MAG: aspartate kinase [Clostridia bacterium]|nr:aspartate kinase [Clostridia bacterium]
MRTVVTKFGGTSMADADKFRQVAHIIREDPDRRYVVVSAPGKRFKGDFKITDMFYLCYEKAEAGENIDVLFDEISGRYNAIIDELGLNISLDREFQRIRNGMYNMTGRDYAASRGEYLNAKILAAYLHYDFIDAREVIFFNNDGTFNAEYTNDVLSARLKRHERAVFPGFYGAMPNGTIKTFSRGGSDITGSIVARAAGAELYENWTDVSGFLMADPRIVDDPKIIKTITYRELRELSYMGATVLHEDAIFPVQIAGIPINIKNTDRPQDRGTMIVADTPEYDTKNVITGIAGRKGFTAINISKDLMNVEVGFGRRVLGILEKKKISFEHLPSGIDTMSVIVKNSELSGKLDYVLNGIQQEACPDSVSVEDGIALIAVVGRAMVKSKGTAAKVFKAIAEADVNVKMIDQGSDELNIIIGIDEEDFEKTIRAIYAEFIRG